MDSHERAMERRQFLKGTLGAASLVALAGCDNLSQSSWFPSILSKAEKLTERAQRAITPANALAKEYGEVDISKVFPANGNTDPGTGEYAEHVAQKFANWTVMVGGLVQTPTSWTLAALKELPSRTQITRHDCVEAGAQSASGPASRSVISYVRFNPCRMPAMQSSIVPMWMKTGCPTTRAWLLPTVSTRKRFWPTS